MSKKKFLTKNKQNKQDTSTVEIENTKANGKIVAVEIPSTFERKIAVVQYCDKGLFNKNWRITRICEKELNFDCDEWNFEFKIDNFVKSNIEFLKLFSTENSVLTLIFLEHGDCRDFQRFIIDGIEKEKAKEPKEPEWIEPLKVAFDKQAVFRNNLEKQPGEELLSRIRRKVTEYENSSGQFYAPYTAIVQSSGYGKSKQLEILSRKENVHLIYCNLASKKTLGFPRPTEFFQNYFTEDGLTNGELSFRANIYFSEFLRTIEENNKLDEPKRPLFNFYSLSEDTSLHQRFKEILRSTSKSRKELKRESSDELVLFAFDEARILVERNFTQVIEKEFDYETYFSVLRREISNLPSNCFVIFMDTLGSVQLFTPIARNDSSLKVSKKGIKLLKPIHSLPTWNLFAQKRIKAQKVSDLATLDYIVTFGRPLWYALYNQNEKKKIIDVAMQKLSCERNDYKQLLNDSDKGRLFALAVIGCRTVIKIVPTCMETSRLVADYMATCFYISDDRSKMIVDYLPEPILAEASARICNFSVDLRHLYLQTVRECITEGIINQGIMGELAARYIILSANDQAASKSPNKPVDLSYTVPVKLKEFLNELVGEKNVKDICNYYENEVRLGKKELDRLMQGYVCFNHFIKDDPDFFGHSILGKRLGARICIEGHPLTDLEIPVFLDPDNLNDTTMVLIRVKTTTEPKMPDDFYKTNPIELKYEEPLRDVKMVENRKPFLVLWMELGKLKTNKSNRVFWGQHWEPGQRFSLADTYAKWPQMRTYVKKKQVFVAIRGINATNYPALSNKEIDELNKLSFAKADYANLKSSDKEFGKTTKFSKFENLFL